MGFISRLQRIIHTTHNSKGILIRSSDNHKVERPLWRLEPKISSTGSNSRTISVDFIDLALLRIAFPHTMLAMTEQYGVEEAR